MYNFTLLGFLFQKKNFIAFWIITTKLWLQEEKENLQTISNLFYFLKNIKFCFSRPNYKLKNWHNFWDDLFVRVFIQEKNFIAFWIITIKFLLQEEKKNFQTIPNLFYFLKNIKFCFSGLNYKLKNWHNFWHDLFVRFFIQENIVIAFWIIKTKFWLQEEKANF